MLEHLVPSVCADENSEVAIGTVGQGDVSRGRVGAAHGQWRIAGELPDLDRAVQGAVGREEDAVDPRSAGLGLTGVAHLPLHGHGLQRQTARRGIDRLHAQISGRREGHRDRVQARAHVVRREPLLEQHSAGVRANQNSETARNAFGKRHGRRAGVGLAWTDRAGAKRLADEDIAGIEHSIGGEIQTVGPWTSTGGAVARVPDAPEHVDPAAGTGGCRCDDRLDTEVGERCG